jgi:hypothetical protein
VWRSTRQASAIFAGRSVSGLMSRFERGATPRPAIKFGQICKWPKQRDCKSRPFRVRRFESVLCPPLCGHGLRVETLVANERGEFESPCPHQSRPCSSVVERRFEEPRVRGSIPLSGAGEVSGHRRSLQDCLSAFNSPFLHHFIPIRRARCTRRSVKPSSARFDSSDGSHYYWLFGEKCG